MQIAMAQTTQKSIRRRLLLGALTVGVFIGTAVPARAQSFISPMYGVNFGGVSGCPQLVSCTDKQTNLSLGAGVFRRIIGVEAEVAYAPTFFGEAAGLSSNVLTLMGNVMLAPQVGPLRPYMLGGLGLIRTHVELTTSSVLTTNDNVLGFGVGGGVILFITSHFGVRGEMRYFHSFSDFAVGGLTLSSDNVDYSRASVGVVVKF